MYKFGLMASALTLLLTGCAGMQLEKAKQAPMQGTLFERFLINEYRNLSQAEFNEGDYKDSDFFALRAIAASTPGDVVPQEVGERDVPTGKVLVLESARKRVMNAKARGAAAKVPGPLAKAQTSYDCWLQEQEENRQPKDIAACQKAFTTHIAAVEKALEPKFMAKKAEPAKPMMKAEESKPAKPSPVKFTIYFEFDSDELVSGAQTIVGNIVRIAKGRDGAKITLEGHTDLAGNRNYNERLSARRAAAVAQALVKAGVSPKSLKTRYQGETAPAKKTEDGVRSPFNRRVMVVIE